MPPGEAGGAGRAPTSRRWRTTCDGLADRDGATGGAEILDRDRADAATGMLLRAHRRGRSEPALDRDHDDARTDEETDSHGRDVVRGVHGEQVACAGGDEEHAGALARRERELDDRDEAGEAEDERRGVLHADRRGDDEHEDSAERETEQGLRADAEGGEERREHGRRGAERRILLHGILFLCPLCGHQGKRGNWTKHRVRCENDRNHSHITRGVRTVTEAHNLVYPKASVKCQVTCPLPIKHSVKNRPATHEARPGQRGREFRLALELFF